jgi:hypothetical protein
VLGASPKVIFLSGERHRERVVSPKEEAQYFAATSPLLHHVSLMLFDAGVRLTSAAGMHPGNRLVRCGIIALVVCAALAVLMKLPSVPDWVLGSVGTAIVPIVPSDDGIPAPAGSSCGSSSPVGIRLTHYLSVRRVDLPFPSALPLLPGGWSPLL